MVSLLLCGGVLYRRAPLFNTLAASALLQLAIDPETLFFAGWQFSYSVVFAILAITPPLEGWICQLRSPDPFIPPKLFTRWERWEFSGWSYFAGLLAVSTAAWVGSLLPTIVYFHLISLSAIGANLLAVPLAFVVLALGALSLLTGTLSLWVAGAFNNANWLVAKLLLLVVQTSALLPGGHWFVGPLPKPWPVITIFDLGGAACSVVQSGGEFALLNAGRKRDAERTILPFLESCGANTIQNLLITKSDAAHLGGVLGIERELRVMRLDAASGNSRSPVAKAILKEFSKSSMPLVAGSSLPLLHGVDAEMFDFQSQGMGVRLHSGESRILFLPRLTPELIRQIESIPVESLRSGVLVLPLGGSEILSSLSVIRKVSPAILISPVDHLGREGVPSQEWEHLLAQEGIKFLRQDQTGAVIIEADPKQMRALPFVPQNDRVGRDRSGGQ